MTSALPETLPETIESGPLCITDLFQDKSIAIFSHKKLKKPPPKVAYLWQLGGFFSLQNRLPKTAQNFISVL